MRCRKNEMSEKHDKKCLIFPTEIVSEIWDVGKMRPPHLRRKHNVTREGGLRVLSLSCFGISSLHLLISIRPRASYLSCQVSFCTTLAHNLGGGRPPLPSKTSTRNVWIQPWFIRYCWVYRKSVNKLLIDSYTFNGILQSVERSCPIDRHELVYIDKEWAGRGGSFLISPRSNC